MSEAAALFSQCQQALADAGPLVQAAPDAHWVMDLDAYKRLRGAAKEAGRDDPEDDPEKWEPHPDDRLMGRPIEVREDSGEPHLVSELANVRLA